MVPGSGVAGTLLGRPVFPDSFMPTAAAGARTILFDWSRYWVRTVGGLRFERSDDFAFDRDVISFRGLWRGDGALIDTTGAIKAWQAAAA